MKKLILVAGIAALFCGTAMAENVKYPADKTAQDQISASEVVAGTVSATDQATVTVEVEKSAAAASPVSQLTSTDQPGISDMVTEPASLAIFGLAPLTIAMFIRRRR
ncbi:MAG: hypothetical protein JO041_05355 [Acidobacteria bacterium]|nr:hypothetical protein [Acidobacteriota bacterium]